MKGRRKQGGREALRNLSISDGVGATIKEVPMENWGLIKIAEGCKEKEKGKALPEWAAF